MNLSSATIDLPWQGPYSWPGYEKETGLPPIPKIPGVYLQTFYYRGGYLIYAAGITRRMIPVRLKEHNRKYNNGEYNVFNMDYLKDGIRKEIWHGWGYAREHRDEFDDNKEIILEAVKEQLACFRIFIANPGTERRVLERIEAAIMNNLYLQELPICDIPDKGMYLAPKFDNELPITVFNHCEQELLGLPECLEI